MERKSDSFFRVLKDYSIYPHYGARSPRALLQRLTKDDPDLIQRLGPYYYGGPPNSLLIHSGCVNTIQWNETGNLLLSGSDDQRFKITDPFSTPEGQVLVDYKTTHKSNIFSARFLPLSNDKRVLSCSDGLTLLTHIDRSPKENESSRFHCHEGTIYKLLTVPNEAHSFLSCGEDGTVRFYDLRVKESCNCIDKSGGSSRRSGDTGDILINTCNRAITSMSINPRSPYLLALGVSDSSVRIYDRRRLSIGSSTSPSKGGGGGSLLRRLTVPEFENVQRFYRITSTTYSGDGQQILASFSSDYLYLFAVNESPSPIKKVEEEEVAEGEEVEETLEDSPKRSGSGGKKGMRRLRLRGDWSDTGPNARPNRSNSPEVGQQRPTLHSSLMERMTTVLSQMLNESFGPPEEEERVEGEEGLPLERLENQLASLRESFIERHQAEPAAVNLSMQEGGPSAGLISMSIGNESERESLGQTPSPSPSTSSQSQVPLPQSPGSPKQVPPLTKKRKLDLLKTLPNGKIIRKFSGHRNARTMIKEANFWGDEYIISGSDCGHVFFWNRFTGEVVNVLVADSHVVNCVQPHPTLPILASSGIDYDIKLWAPTLEQSRFEEQDVLQLMKRNAVMLEETKDTITVPASFMVRMLTCLNQIRRRSNPDGGTGGGRSADPGQGNSQSDSQ